MSYIAKVDFLDALDGDKQYRAGDEFSCSDTVRLQNMCDLEILEKVGDSSEE